MGRPSAGAGGRTAAARQRLEALLDPGSFVERFSFTGAPGPGAGLDEGAEAVVGVGTVDGRDVAVHAVGPLPPGGSLGEQGAAKVAWALELALRSRIPIVGLADWRGARPAEDLAALARWADVLRLHVRASGVVPQVALVFGRGPGASYAAELSDFVIAVDAGAEDGPECGAHFLAADEGVARSCLRLLLSHLPGCSGETPLRQPYVPDPEGREPEALPLASLPPGQPYDMCEVAAGLVDGGELLWIRPLPGPGLLAGFGRLDGHPVGVVASQPMLCAGTIDAGAASKAARFVRFCDAFNLPVLSLIDTAGVAADAPAQQAAQLVYAYAEATVPRLAVVTGAVRGSGYLLMSPRVAGADLSLAWPAVKVAAAGPEPAAERGLVDAVVEPRETRRELIRVLRLSLGRRAERPVREHGNIPL